MDKITHTVVIEYMQHSLSLPYRVHATPKHAAGEFWKNGMHIVGYFHSYVFAKEFVENIFGNEGILLIET